MEDYQGLGRVRTDSRGQLLRRLRYLTHRDHGESDFRTEILDVETPKKVHRARRGTCTKSTLCVAQGQSPHLRCGT
eukprot:6334415-Lingulodinium_polyedra.AAC.1